MTNSIKKHANVAKAIDICFLGKNHQSKATVPLLTFLFMYQKGPFVAHGIAGNLKK
jgi:hypothetical protein